MNDFVGTSNKRQFVIDQLRMYSGPKKEMGENSTFVSCPFHAENTPSGRIFHSIDSRSPGFFKCYGCGETAPWNDVAPKLGLKPFSRVAPQEEYANMSLMLQDDDAETEDEADSNFVAEEMKLKALPRNKVWRGIKTNLLIELGAKVCKVRHPEHGWLVPKIYLPTIINGEVVGYTKARMKKHADYPSYIHAKGSWSKVQGLFPFDYSMALMKELGSKTMVIVEGQRDALRLIQDGIPAVCIMGTNSWGPAKAKLLELAGVSKIVIMMDGDDAGIQATAKIAPSVELMFDVRVIKLWSLKGSPYIQFKDEAEPSKAAKAAGVSLWDPGSVPSWVINKLRNTFFTRS